MKHSPEVLHGASLSLLWKNERSPIELPDQLLMAPKPTTSLLKVLWRAATTVSVL